MSTAARRALLALLAAVVATAAPALASLASVQRPPGPNGGPVEVAVEFELIGIYDVNFQELSINLQALMRQRWRDPRLARPLPANATVDRINGLRYELTTANVIGWVPDSSFASTVRHVDVEPRRGDPAHAYNYFRRYEDGEVLAVQRIELTHPMEVFIDFYPYEVIDVHVHFESFGHTLDQLVYTSNGARVIVREPLPNVPGYEVLQRKADAARVGFATYDTGNYSSITMGFTLNGETGGIVLHAVVPLTVLIVLSSIPLWYDTGFAAKVSISSAALLSSFAFSFSFTLPDSREPLYIEQYFRTSFVWIGVSVTAVILEFLVSFHKNRWRPVQHVASVKAGIEAVRDALQGDKSKRQTPTPGWRAGITALYLCGWLANVGAFGIAGQIAQNRFLAESVASPYEKTATVFAAVYVVLTVLSLAIALAACLGERHYKNVWRAHIARIDAEAEAAEHARNAVGMHAVGGGGAAGVGAGGGGGGGGGGGVGGPHAHAHADGQHSVSSSASGRSGRRRARMRQSSE